MAPSIAVSSTSSPSAVVLIVNYYSGTATADLIASLLARSTLPLCISIVDTSESLEEFRALEVMASRWRLDACCLHLTRAPSNLGYSGGNNLAFTSIPHPYPPCVVVANPDSALIAGDLGDLISALADTPDAVVVPVSRGGDLSQHTPQAPELRLLTGRSSTSPVTGPVRLGEGRTRLAYFPGHFWGVCTSTWLRLDGLDDAYFLYSEELDFVLRARASGKPLSLICCRSLEVRHPPRSPAPRDAARSLLTHYHSTKSRVLLYSRHRRLRPWLPLLVSARVLQAAVLALSGRRHQGRAVAAGLKAGLANERSRASSLSA